MTTPFDRRVVALAWLRRIHRWSGLWVAILALLFAPTGLLMNHRATLRIALGAPRESVRRVALPAPAPVDAKAFGDWVARMQAGGAGTLRVREEPSRPVPWGDGSLRQPAHWIATLATPASVLQADYWVGRPDATFKRSDNDLLTALTNLHKGNGMGVGWVLLVDTLAAGLLVLVLSGITLWALSSRRRAAGLAILAASAGSLFAAARLAGWS
jgi:hypothetical protein